MTKVIENKLLKAIAKEAKTRVECIEITVIYPPEEFDGCDFIQAKFNDKLYESFIDTERKIYVNRVYD